MAESVLLRNISSQTTATDTSEDSVPFRRMMSVFREKNLLLRWAKYIWRHDRLSVCLILSVILGLIVGLASNKSVQSLDIATRTTTLILINFPGEMLMRMLMMLILPLIICSIIVGFAEVDQEASGKLSRNTVLYYVVTMTISLSLGIVLAASIKPGQGAVGHFEKTEETVRALDSVLDLIRNLFPPNLIQAAFMKTTTDVLKLRTDLKNVTLYFPLSSHESLENAQRFWTSSVNATHNVTFYQTWKTVSLPGETKLEDGTNLLGLVVFAIIFGILLGKMRDEVGILIDWLRMFNNVIIRLLNIVMWFAPIGIFSLLAGQFASMEDISGSFERLGLYMATVLVGLHIHALIILPILYFAVVRKNPFSFMRNTAPTLLATWGTSSSSATFPISYRCLTEKNGIDKRVARLVLPIGAIINLDGAALYEAVACIFVAQLTGAQLNLTDYVRISITATLVSVGASGLPEGLVTLFVALHATGMPAKDAFPFVVAVDWLLDRFRTAFNVLGDCYGAAIIAKITCPSSQPVRSAKPSGVV